MNEQRRRKDWGSSAGRKTQKWKSYGPSEWFSEPRKNNTKVFISLDQVRGFDVLDKLVFQGWYHIEVHGIESQESDTVLT